MSDSSRDIDDDENRDGDGDFLAISGTGITGMTHTNCHPKSTKEKLLTCFWGKGKRKRLNCPPRPTATISPGIIYRSFHGFRRFRLAKGDYQSLVMGGGGIYLVSALGSIAPSALDKDDLMTWLLILNLN